MSLLEDLLFTVVSLTNTQGLFSRLIPVQKFLPRIFRERYIQGSGLTPEEAEEIFRAIPSLESRQWAEFWYQTGLKFERQRRYRAACMSHIIGVFPREDFPVKRQLNERKTATFAMWAAERNHHFEERIIDSPDGMIRFYFHKPENIERPVPMTLFINGLEGSAEEFAFPLSQHLGHQMGYALLSIPGSFDYEKPMTVNSDLTIRHVMDHLAQFDWVNPNAFGMVGFSFGAYWTLVVAKTDPRVRFALCNGIPLHHTLAAKAGFGLNPVIAHALCCLFNVSHPLKLIPVVKHLLARADDLINRPSGPILAMNGDQDTIVDARDTEILGSKPGNKLMFFKNDDHCGLFHYERMVQVIVAFIRRQVRFQDAQAKASSLVAG